MTVKDRRRLRAIGFGLATVLLGLSVRFLHVGLPWVVMKYGGSMLWAVMIFWIFSALIPQWPLMRIALLSGTVATAVEIFKLYRSPGMDAFRLTLAGKLTLGRVFSGWDIAAYWVAIAAGMALEFAIRRASSRA
ncbi:MAG: DUF2809 domain-containing protein [Terracidiphilus sp.]|jgi:hypothetical protein